LKILQGIPTYPFQKENIAGYPFIIENIAGYPYLSLPKSWIIENI